MSENEKQPLKPWIAIIVIIIFTSLIATIMVSIILASDSKIFSSWFIDTYKPSKGLVVEKPPVRIMFFGEAQENPTAIELIKIINALDKTEFHNYKFNPETTIEFRSAVSGLKAREARKKIKVHIKSPMEIDNNQFVSELPDNSKNKK